MPSDCRCFVSADSLELLGIIVHEPTSHSSNTIWPWNSVQSRGSLLTPEVSYGRNTTTWFALKISPDNHEIILRDRRERFMKNASCFIVFCPHTKKMPQFLNPESCPTPYLVHLILPTPNTVLRISIPNIASIGYLTSTSTLDSHWLH